MKIREISYMLGLRPRAREYPFRVATFKLPDDGEVQFAQWLHPKETAKVISSESVGRYRQFLRPGDVVIDIGAHTGDTTVPMALAVGPTGQVLAFEPNPYVFRVLSANAELNPGKTNITPLPFAVAEHDGQMTFDYSDPGFCNGGFHKGISRWRHGHAFRLEVKTRNLTAYLTREHPELLERLRYIKIDAEGYDYEILRTLRPVIEKRCPYLTVELFKKLSPATRQQMFSFLNDLGYHLFLVEHDVGHGNRRLTQQDFQTIRHADIFCEPGVATKSTRAA